MLPLAGALAAVLAPREKAFAVKTAALVSSLLSLALSVAVFWWYNPYAPGAEPAAFWFEERLPWFPAWGITWHLGVDGLNAPLVLLCGILALAAVLASWNIRKDEKKYFILLLLVLSGTFGLFLSLDLFFLLLFYELASVPMYFLIGIWGSDKDDPIQPVKKENSAMKLMLYLQLGGGLVLLGILGVNILSGAHSFDLPVLMEAGRKLPLLTQKILFLLLFIGFAIEAGIFPFHNWLPDGHSAAPTAVSMLLAGVLLKMGGYGILRLGMGLAPQGALWAFKFLAWVAVVNILYGALCALAQKDIKYLIAYSSISHMGFVLLGLAAFTPIGANGALFQMVSHGVITALLFAGAGLIYERTGTRNLERLGGLAGRMPFLAATFTAGGLAALGLPGTSGFVAEFLVFMGSFKSFPLLTVLSILSLLLAAVYILRTVQKVFFGPMPPEYESLADMAGIEKWPLALLLLSILLFGLHPSFILDTTRISIMQFLNDLGGMFN
jgi:NADH-quinone oxidoreductase subunit M